MRKPHPDFEHGRALLDHGKPVRDLLGGERHILVAEQQGLDREEAARVLRQEDLHLVVDRMPGSKARSAFFSARGSYTKLPTHSGRKAIPIS